MARGTGGGAFLPLVAVLLLLVGAAVSLVSFSAQAHHDGRTNTRLLASLGALEAAYRTGDVVSVDRAMYRDWTLTGPGAGPRFCERLNAWWRAEQGPAPPEPWPFAGGWFLYLGYELAGEVDAGVALPGLYPANEATRARYDAWTKSDDAKR